MASVRSCVQNSAERLEALHYGFGRLAGDLGISHLYKLKCWLGEQGAVFPLETGSQLPDCPVVIGEIYPSFYSFDYMIPLQEQYPNQFYDILDARQVRQVCDQFACFMQTKMRAAYLFDIKSIRDSILKEEGWIVGVPANGKTV